MNPGAHQRGAGVVPGAIVLGVLSCPEPDETGWSSLGNQTVRFDYYHELAPAFVLVSAFSSGTMSCSTTTFFGRFSASGFILLLAEVSLLNPICH
jgi:hypothetical protein